MSITKIDETYVGLKRRSLDNMSICRMFNILKDENDEYFLNIFKNIEISSDILLNDLTSMKINIIEPWWEMISYSYYGDVQTWWIPCVSNKILNPFEQIGVGGSLNMLSKKHIPYIQRDMEVIFNL